jgi:hypothetical protein
VGANPRRHRNHYETRVEEKQVCQMVLHVITCLKASLRLRSYLDKLRFLTHHTSYSVHLKQTRFWFRVASHETCF